MGSDPCLNPSSGKCCRACSLLMSASLLQASRRWSSWSAPCRGLHQDNVRNTAQHVAHAHTSQPCSLTVPAFLCSCMHQLPLNGASMHAAGQLVFHGPREEIVGFFSTLNMKVPERKAVPDFLQEVTSVKDQKVRLHASAL